MLTNREQVLADQLPPVRQMTGDQRPAARKIFVVMGCTGEYSDRSEWLVAAYEDEEKANAHCMAASQWFRDELQARPDEALGWDERAKIAERSPFDPNMAIDYTGTSYFVCSVALLNELPRPPLSDHRTGVEAGETGQRSCADGQHET